MALLLRWKGSTTLPVEGEGLRPDLLAGLAPAEVSRRLIHQGNRPVEIGDLFDVSGTPEVGRLVLEGDLTRVRRIAADMESGDLEIRGDAGAGLGRRMRGGTILLQGSAGPGAGMAMRGGMLHIEGSAGDGLGGAEPGEPLGMREGVILVKGSIGGDSGLSMRRGLIAVLGDAGAGLGRSMVAGSAFAFGAVGPGAGVSMKRGTLALFGPEPPRLRPTFAASGRDRPPFLTIYLRKLREWGFPVPEAAFASDFDRYNGDQAEGGQGEILVHRPAVSR